MYVTLLCRCRYGNTCKYKQVNLLGDKCNCVCVRERSVNVSIELRWWLLESCFTVEMFHRKFAPKAGLSSTALKHRMKLYTYRERIDFNFELLLYMVITPTYIHIRVINIILLYIQTSLMYVEI